MSDYEDNTERPQVVVRAYEQADLPAMARIWNEVVEAGRAFPQDETLGPREAADFFAAQSFTGVAELQGQVVGL